MAILRPERGGRVRLDVPLVHCLGGELPFHDDIGLPEPLLQVAPLKLNVAGDVTLSSILAGAGPFNPEPGGQVLMQQGRIGLHGLADVQDRRQHFVVDLDQVEGCFSHVGIEGATAAIAWPMYSTFWLARMLSAIIRALPLGLGKIDDPVLDDGEVFEGAHRIHAGQGLGLAGVNGMDAGMGMGAAQDFAVQHAGQVDIGPEFGPAGHLVQTIVADGPGAHHGVVAWAAALDWIVVVMRLPLLVSLCQLT